MAGITPVVIVGIGRIWDMTDNVELGNQSEFMIAQNLDELEIPLGSNFDKAYLTTGRSWSARFGFKELTAGLMAALIGGSAATGSNKLVESEEGTIPGSVSYVVTLDHTPYAGSATYAPITVVDTAGIVYEQVAPASEAAGKFSHTAGVLTFHEDDKSKTVYVSYPWYDDSAGKIITPTVGTLPGSKEIFFGGYGYSTIEGASKGYFTVYAKKVQITGEMPVGASVGDVANITLEGRVTVSVATDLAISLEN